MTSKRRGFISAGCWCVDHNKQVPYWPAENRAVVVQSSVRSGGGSACNFGINMRCLDPTLAVSTIGLVGDDADGQFLLSEAQRFGIDTEQLHVTRAAPTMFTEAFQSQASGLRTHIATLGCADLLAPDHFQFESSTARILHLGLPSLHAVLDAPWQTPHANYANGWVAILQQAKAAGLATNLELVSNSADILRPLVLPCLPYLDTLVVNDYEIGALADLPTVQQGQTDASACEQAAWQVLAAGSMQVVVVHFTQGAVLVSRAGQCVHQPSVHIPPSAIQGANGAGDAFAAGFLYAWHEDWDYKAALQLGHAAAAMSLQSVKTNGCIGTVSECLAEAERWGWRSKNS